VETLYLIRSVPSIILSAHAPQLNGANYKSVSSCGEFGGAPNPTSATDTRMQEHTGLKFCLGQCRKGHSSYLSMNSEERTSESSIVNDSTPKKATLVSTSSEESSLELKKPVYKPSTANKNSTCSGRRKNPILFLSSAEEDGALLVVSENKSKYSSGSEPELEESFAALQAKLEDRKSKLPGCLQCFCWNRSNDITEEQVKIISSEDLYAMLDETSPPKKAGKATI